jgi:hypothetical protein
VGQYRDLKMKVAYHTLYWDNVDDRIIQSHKKVFNHFGIDIQYTSMNINQGVWMTGVCRNTFADVYVFFEIDCVPLNKQVIDDCINYAVNNNSFIGSAQVSNHIPPKTHVYVAPCFLTLSRTCYEELGMPSFYLSERSDTAEELSYTAESFGKRYRCLYPTKFDGVPKYDGVWRLSNYGYYGVGTLYDNKIYHLFESRWSDHIDLFEKRCEQIISNTFDTNGMYSSLDEFVGNKTE